MKPLNEKAARFVDEYLIDMNATQAAIRCGYSEKSARKQGERLKRNPRVKELLDKKMAERAERTGINQDYVVMVIKETVERCRQTVEPILDKRGQPVLTEDRDGNLKPAFKFDARGVLMGTEQLGRHLGIFKDKVEHTGKDGGPIETKDVSSLTDDQLLAILLEEGDSAGAADPKARTH